MSRHRKIFCVAFTLLLTVSVTGCVILAPIIDGVRQTGVSESDRQRLLGEEVKKFYDALYWGSPTVATAFAADEGREQISQIFKNRDKNERLVESKIEAMDFSDSSYKAEVHVAEKFYKIPYYMVNTRVQKQEWEFSLVSGWKITSQEMLEDSQTVKTG